jgi:hypothetical protein
VKDLTSRRPCDNNGDFLPWLHELRNQSGAYIIRERAGLFSGVLCLYVGKSHTGSLAKTIKRHFYAWRDNSVCRHHTYDRRREEIAVRLTPPLSAVGAQNSLIIRLNPRDNCNGWGEQPY